MENIFYKIWADAIITSSKIPQNKNDWKFKIMLIMTILISLNLMTILMWIGNLLHINVVWVKIEFFPGTMLNSFSSYGLQFGLPSLLLNYFFVFHKKKHIQIAKKYSDKKGKLVMAYLILTLLVFIVPVIIHKIVKDVL